MSRSSNFCLLNRRYLPNRDLLAACHLVRNSHTSPAELVLNRIMGAPPISWTHRTCSSNPCANAYFLPFVHYGVSKFLTSRSINCLFTWFLNVAWSPRGWLGPRSLSFGCVGELLRVCHPWVEVLRYSASACMGLSMCCAPICVVVACGTMNIGCWWGVPDVGPAEACKVKGKGDEFRPLDGAWAWRKHVLGMHMTRVVVARRISRYCIAPAKHCRERTAHETDVWVRSTKSNASPRRTPLWTASTTSLADMHMRVMSRAMHMVAMATTTTSFQPGININNNAGRMLAEKLTSPTISFKPKFDNRNNRLVLSNKDTTDHFD